MARAGIVSILVAGALLSACAHQITISPRVMPSPEGTPIPKNVGLYISPAQLSEEMTTPAGAGDKLAYHPYADLQAGIYWMLGDVFQSVTVLRTLDDADAIGKHSLTYIIQPQITVSSRGGLENAVDLLAPLVDRYEVTFTVGLTCRITDATGQALASVSVTGVGNANFSIWKPDFALAGARATQDALLKAQAALAQSAALRE